MSEDLEYSQYKILDRTGSRSFLRRRAEPQFEILRQIVDYGVPLIQPYLRESERKVEDIVLLPDLLRQSITTGDAVHFQLMKGANQMSTHGIRSCFGSAGVQYRYVMKIPVGFPECLPERLAKSQL